MSQTRMEHDSLGAIEVPADAYWGAQTARAVINYPISGRPIRPGMVWALVSIKRAAAIANAEVGGLDARIAQAIVGACDDILGGALLDQFVVDAFQAGAGTSSHMNANEVIASLASERLQGPRSPSGKVHPNDDVNRGQSTNDVFPTAMRLAALCDAQPLLAALGQLVHSVAERGKDMLGVIKSGRTHLQDASPIRLGREIGAWAENLERHRQAIETAAAACGELGIGGTATGTGLTAAPGYRERVVEELGRTTGLRLWPAADLYEAMQSLRPIQHLSSSLRDLALDLFRITADLRLLSSGPTTGLGELRLPEVQPGSSIMPGKVNPSIPEMVGQVCARVIGCDTTIAWSTAAGQIDLNVFFPVAADSILEAEGLLAAAIRVLDERTIRGLRADEARCRAYAASSQQLVLALAPMLGYEKAAELAKRAMAQGRTIEEQAVHERLLSADEAARLLDPALLAGD